MIRARIESAISAGVRAPMSIPAGVSSAAEQLVGDALGAELIDHGRAALPARHEPDVGQAGLEAGPQDRDLVLPVRRHDERQVRRRRA